MFVNFVSLRFKNVLSYGSTISEIYFNEGLNAIVGKNGEGKSTFLDALSFCLYGVPYRRIKISELINRRNRKNLWTECIFTINKNEYKIIRSLSPDSISIKKNDNELELLSTKRLIQDEINKILGIDYNMFKQIICLAINYNRPFLSLKSADKRDIVESIFNIKIFGIMLNNLKNTQKGLRIQQEINSKTLSITENAIKSLKKQIQNLKITERDFEKNQVIDIRNLNGRITKYEKEVKICNENIIIASNSISKIKLGDITSLKEKMKKIRNDISVDEYIIDKIKNDLESIENEDNCPLCESVLSTDHKNNHIKKLKKKQLTAKKNTAKLLIKKKSTESSIGKEEINLKKIEDIKIASQRQNDKLIFIKKEIDTCLKSKKDMENKKMSIDITPFQNEYDDKKKDYVSLYKKNKTLNTDIVNNDIVSNILSEQGIKAHFFRKLLPILNNKINEFLNKFELPVLLIFNELMDEKITSLNNGRVQLPYMSFSEGEKKRIDISILLSFIDTTKSISNWNCNLIFFDELFDNATDVEGLDKIMQTIKSMTYDNNKLCIYVISHRLADDDIFKRRIEVTKSSNFSKIKEVNELKQ